MITYESGDYHLAFLCKVQGSIIPRALAFSLPSAGLAVLFSHMLEKDDFRMEFMKQLNQSSVWSASILIVGMLVAFRTNKAYDRFWEGITLVQQMRAEWFEAASNLMAFSEVAAKKDPTNTQMVRDVDDFQLVLIRLLSLMHGAALRQIGGYEEEFPVLDIQGLDEDSLLYLADCEEILSNRVEVLLHWIQVLITDAHTKGVLNIPPPILTRAYQTLSRGMVNLHDARKLADVPFPFPLSQLVVVLILLQSLVTPVFVCTIVEHAVLSAVVSFLPVFGMWSLIFIAGQLEQPFGQDVNDLPLSVLQFDMNTSLLMLLEAKHAPTLKRNACRSVLELRSSLSNMQSSSTHLDVVEIQEGSCSVGMLHNGTDPTHSLPSHENAAIIKAGSYRPHLHRSDTGKRASLFKAFTAFRQYANSRSELFRPFQRKKNSLGQTARFMSHQDQLKERTARLSLAASSVSSNSRVSRRMSRLDYSQPGDRQDGAGLSVLQAEEDPPAPQVVVTNANAAQVLLVNGPGLLQVTMPVSQVLDTSETDTVMKESKARQVTTPRSPRSPSAAPRQVQLPSPELQDGALQALEHNLCRSDLPRDQMLEGQM